TRCTRTTSDWRCAAEHVAGAVLLYDRHIRPDVANGVGRRLRQIRRLCGFCTSFTCSYSCNRHINYAKKPTGVLRGIPGIELLPGRGWEGAFGQRIDRGRSV